MKNFRIKKRISDYLNRNKWQILIVFASLFAGIIIGSFFSVRMSSDKYGAIEKYINNFVSAYGLQSVNNKEIFKFSVYNNIKIILFLWLSGIWVGFLPFGMLQIGLKGYKIGFSTTLFMKVFGGKGIAFSIISLMPQIILMLPMIIIYFIFNISFACALKDIRLQRTASSIKNKLYIKNLFFFLAAVVVSMLLGIVDAYVVPPILKPICTFMNR